MNEIRITIATDFTTTPGPRNQDEGDFSGEAFLGKVLRSAFAEAQKRGCTLFIDLDGTEGYATSFLEAAFGQLARETGIEKVLDCIRFKSDEDPYLVEEIQQYIREAKD